MSSGKAFATTSDLIIAMAVSDKCPECNFDLSYRHKYGCRIGEISTSRNSLLEIIKEKDKEIAKWKGEAELHLTQAIDYQKRFHAQESEIKRLRAALEFYGCENNWHPKVKECLEYSCCHDDSGKTARDALAGGKDE